MIKRKITGARVPPLYICLYSFKAVAFVVIIILIFHGLLVGMTGLILPNTKSLDLRCSAHITRSALS